MNILFTIKVKILVPMKWSSYRSLHLCWLLSLECSTYFEFVAKPLLIKHMSFWYPFLEPHLTMYHSNIGVWLRQGTELGTSSLVVTVFIFSSTIFRRSVFGPCTYVELYTFPFYCCFHSWFCAFQYIPRITITLCNVFHVSTYWKKHHSVSESSFAPDCRN